MEDFNLSRETNELSVICRYLQSFEECGHLSGHKINIGKMQLLTDKYSPPEEIRYPMHGKQRISNIYEKKLRKG